MRIFIKAHLINFCNKMVNLRKKLNDCVKEVGNNYSSELVKKGNGLGDILTSDLTFRRIMPVIGAVTPFILLYDNNVPMYAKAIASFVFSFPVGYATGVILDDFFGEKTLIELEEKYKQEELERRANE